MAHPQKTTTNYKCYFVSYDMVESDNSQPNTISETWIIEKKEAGQSYSQIKFEGIDYRQMLAEGAIPNIGATYSAWNTNATSANYAKWQKDAECLGHAFNSLQGGRVQVVHTFSTRLRNDPKDNTALTVTLRLPTSAEYQAGTRQTETFMMRPWTIQPQPSGSGSTGHIGGTAAIGGSKQGMIEDVPIVNINVRTVKDANEMNKASLARYFSKYINTYNEPAFFGFSAGTLLYNGYNIIDLEGSLYEVIHNMTYDGLFFNDQVPQMAGDGLPVTANNGTQLSDVRWVRPQKSSFDFKDIFFTGNIPGYNFDAAGMSFAEKGYW
jgi:hypothetical protein